MYRTLISATELRALPTDNLVVLDCRFQLADPSYGPTVYEAGHLPDAHYLHLDYHLSGPKTGDNGRHPLPDGQRLAVNFGALGIGPDTQVVAYDDAGGMYAARAWWLLRWLGHESVAVLDGGVQAWLASGASLTTEAPEKRSTRFPIRAPLEQAVNADDIAANLQQPDCVLVDARAPDRFAGQNETLDPVAGHIPGARNRFFQHNLQDGYFKPAATLATEWQAVLGDTATSDVVLYCGSGVTACLNKLALEHAGLRGSRLYPGSWSEWCSDAGRPVATGA